VDLDLQAAHRRHARLRSLEFEAQIPERKYIRLGGACLPHYRLNDLNALAGLAHVFAAAARAVLPGGPAHGFTTEFSSALLGHGAGLSQVHNQTGLTF
jgi:hypothetical protein